MLHKAANANRWSLFCKQNERQWSLLLLFFPPRLHKDNKHCHSKDKIPLIVIVIGFLFCGIPLIKIIWNRLTSAGTNNRTNKSQGPFLIDYRISPPLWCKFMGNTFFHALVSLLESWTLDRLVKEPITQQGDERQGNLNSTAVPVNLGGTPRPNMLPNNPLYQRHTCVSAITSFRRDLGPGVNQVVFVVVGNKTCWPIDRGMPYVDTTWYDSLVSTKK